jgi:signal transduction histidine kinase
VFIARNRDASRFVGRQLIEPLRVAVRAELHGRGRYPVFDGPDVYSAWQRIPSLGWTVTLGAPVAVVDVPRRRSLMMLAAAGLIVTLVGSGIAIVWGRRISRAMRSLAESAIAIGRGGVSTHRPSTIEEVDAVGRALEAAGGRIAEQTAALLASQARIRRLVDSNLIGIVFGEGRRLVDANEAFLRMTGDSLDELRRGALSWRGLMPADCCPIDGAPAAAVPQEWPACEGEYVRNDGTRIPILVGGALLEPVGPQWVVFVLDLTERQRADEERRLRAEAEAANRAKDDFLAMLSHELRTPLSAILGWTQFLRSPRLTDAQIADALDRIERSTRLQARIVDDLLDVSRIVAGKLIIDKRPVRLVPIVMDALAALGQEADIKGITLLTRFDPAGGTVLGDAERLQQVVLNLVGNAIKFTPSGGHVEVAIAADIGRVVMTVRDTGEGIEPAFLPYVFDRFRQAGGDNGNRSLGLGLAIVRHLVELHDGAVRAESAGRGRGAVFTVELPALRSTILDDGRRLVKILPPGQERFTNRG